MRPTPLTSRANQARTNVCGSNDGACLAGGDPALLESDTAITLYLIPLGPIAIRVVGRTYLW